MKLELHNQYKLDEIFEALNSTFSDAQAFFDGDFYVIDSAVICMVTFDEDCQSSAQKPSLFVWRPNRQIQKPNNATDNFFPSQITDVWNENRERIKEHFVFARKLGERDYTFLGMAHLGSYGYGGTEDGYSARFSLKANLNRDLFLKFGGTLNLPQPILKFDSENSDYGQYRYHSKAFQHLKIKPAKSSRAQKLSRVIESKYQTPLPTSLVEFYDLEDSLNLLKEIVSPHLLNEFEDKHTEWFSDEYFNQHGFDNFLLLICERDGSWQLGVDLDSGEDPKVYIGDYKWELFAESFSECLEAWTFDYVIFNRDYYFDADHYLNDIDIKLVQDVFSDGPISHHVNRFFRSDVFKRFYLDDKRVLVFKVNDRYKFVLSAETADSMLELLSMEWSCGPIISKLNDFDIELQKAFLF